MLCYVRIPARAATPSWSCTTRVCRLRRTRWSECGGCGQVNPRRTEACLRQNNSKTTFRLTLRQVLEVRNLRRRTLHTAHRSLARRTNARERERVSGTPLFSTAPRLSQWTAHRSTGRWLRQALQPSRLLLVPRTNLRSRRLAPRSSNQIQGRLRQQQLFVSNLLDQQLLVVNPQDQ